MYTLHITSQTRSAIIANNLDTLLRSVPFDHLHNSMRISTANTASVVTNNVSSTEIALTREMVQEMIVSAFTTLALQGNDAYALSTWILDSGVSNHMTNSLKGLRNLRKYYGTS